MDKKSDYKIVKSGECPEGYEYIMDEAGCLAAGKDYQESKGFRFDQPAGGYKDSGSGRTKGCTIHNWELKKGGATQFFPKAKGKCGTASFNCLCKKVNEGGKKVNEGGKKEGSRKCVYFPADRKSSVQSWGAARGYWPVPGKLSSAECKKKCYDHPNCVQADTYKHGGCFMYFDNNKQGGSAGRWTPWEDYYRCTGKKVATPAGHCVKCKESAVKMNLGVQYSKSPLFQTICPSRKNKSQCDAAGGTWQTSSPGEEDAVEEKMLEIKVGPASKGNKSKSVTLPVSCPSFMLDSAKKTNQQYPNAVKNKQNPAWGDRFQLDVEDKKLTVNRLDQEGYWGQDLILLAKPDGKGCEETKQRKKAAEEARLAALEAERKRKEAEEAERKKKEAEEAARRAKEEAERRRLEDIARKAAEEAARKKAAAEKAAAEAKAKAERISKENAEGAAAGWMCLEGISTPVRLDKTPVKGHGGDGTGEVSCMSSNAKDCKWGQCPSLKIPNPNKPLLCGPKHKEAGWGSTGYDGGDKHWCNIAKTGLKYKEPPPEPPFYKAKQKLLALKLNQNMKKLGDGCCRFGGIEKGEDKGYRTLDDCLKLCSEDSRCRGADVKGRKGEDKFHCFHYLNDKKPSDYNIGCKEWKQGEQGPYQCYQKIPNEYVKQKTLCKEKYRIKTLEECKEAGLELKTGWTVGMRTQSLSTPQYYTGCSIYDKKKVLTFNKHRIGKPHSAYTGICIKDPNVKVVKEVAKQVQKQAEKQGLPPQLVKQKVKQAVVQVKTAPNPKEEAKNIVPEPVSAPLAASTIKTDTPEGDVPEGGFAPIPAGPVAVSGQDPAVIQNAVRDAAAEGQGMRGQALAAQKIQTKRAALGGMAVQSAIPRSQMVKAAGLRGGMKSPWRPLGKIGGDAAGGGNFAPIGPNRQLKKPLTGQQAQTKDIQEVIKFHEASFHAQNGKKITGGKLSGGNLKGIAYKTNNMAWCIPHKNKKGKVISWIAKPNKQMGWDSRDQCLTMKGGKPIKIPYGSGKCIKGNTEEECKIALKNMAKDAYWHTHPVLMQKVKQGGPKPTAMKFD
jgi:chemotaxis protein histidine kinase CheA